MGRGEKSLLVTVDLSYVYRKGERETKKSKRKDEMGNNNKKLTVYRYLLDIFKVQELGEKIPWEYLNVARRHWRRQAIRYQRKGRRRTLSSPVILRIYYLGLSFNSYMTPGAPSIFSQHTRGTSSCDTFRARDEPKVQNLHKRSQNIAKKTLKKVEFFRLLFSAQRLILIEPIFP